MRSTIKKSLGIYNIAPSLDFEKSTSFEDALIDSNKKRDGFKIPEIHVDRNFNPFDDSENKREVRQNLAEMYHQNIEAEPSKINLFEDEDFEEWT